MEGDSLEWYLTGTGEDIANILSLGVEIELVKPSANHVYPDFIAKATSALPRSGVASHMGASKIKHAFGSAGETRYRGRHRQGQQRRSSKRLKSFRSGDSNGPYRMGASLKTNKTRRTARPPDTSICSTSTNPLSKVSRSSVTIALKHLSSAKRSLFHITTSISSFGCTTMALIPG